LYSEPVEYIPYFYTLFLLAFILTCTSLICVGLQVGSSQEVYCPKLCVHFVSSVRVICNTHLLSPELITNRQRVKVWSCSLCNFLHPSPLLPPLFLELFSVNFICVCAGLL
jgi:hypothetical protein